MKKWVIMFLSYIFCFSISNAQNLDWGDFENNSNWWSTWAGTLEIVDNPHPQINESAKVLKYVPDSLWRGISIFFEKGVFNATHKKVVLDVYADTTTELQLGMPAENFDSAYFAKDTVIGGAWRHLEYDISGLKSYNYKHITFQTVEKTTYYFDNIKVLTTTSVAFKNQANIEVYPNPAKDKIVFNNISAPEYSVRILNYSGQVVRVYKKVVNNSLTIGDLPDGIYFIEIKDRNTSSMTTLIKN